MDKSNNISFILLVFSICFIVFVLIILLIIYLYNKLVKNRQKAYFHSLIIKEENDIVRSLKSMKYQEEDIILFIDKLYKKKNKKNKNK